MKHAREQECLHESHESSHNLTMTLNSHSLSLVFFLVLPISMANTSLPTHPIFPKTRSLVGFMIPILVYCCLNAFNVQIYVALAREQDYSPHSPKESAATVTPPIVSVLESCPVLFHALKFQGSYNKAKYTKIPLKLEINSSNPNQSRFRRRAEVKGSLFVLEVMS